MSEPQHYIIERFNEDLCKFHFSFKPGFYYMDPLRFDNKSNILNFDSTCLTCKTCVRYLKKLGGIPFGEDGKCIFEGIERKSLTREISPETKIVYIAKNSRLEPTRVLIEGEYTDILHIFSACKITGSSLQDTFFGGSEITADKVNELMEEAKKFFESSTIQMIEELIKDLNPTTQKSLAKALNHSFLLSSLTQLEFLNELEKNMQSARTHRKLVREVSKKLVGNNKIRILTELFDPTLVGVNQAERKIINTYQDGKISVSWKSFCDIDIHAKVIRSDTGATVYHIYFDDKSAKGIALDHDNRDGGTSAEPATEIITFDPSFFKENNYKLVVYVLMYDCSRGYREVPFQVEINQYGERTFHRGVWSSDKHVVARKEVSRACFTCEVDIKDPPRRVDELMRPPLPYGFRILDEVERLPLPETKMMTAGVGYPVYMLVETPDESFERPITAIKIPNTQITENILVSDATPDGYFYIEKKLLSEINPIIAFRKQDFKFGKVEESLKYREKNYSPYSNEFNLIDNCLASVGLPVVISHLVLEYYVEPKMISLFGKLPTVSLSSGENFWSKYL